MRHIKVIKRAIKGPGALVRAARLPRIAELMR
jgi:hypothetical protein